MRSACADPAAVPRTAGEKGQQPQSQAFLVNDSVPNSLALPGERQPHSDGCTVGKSLPAFS